MMLKTIMTRGNTNDKAIQEQNKLLIDMIQDKETRSFIDKLKDLFK